MFLFYFVDNHTMLDNLLYSNIELEIAGKQPIRSQHLWQKAEQSTGTRHAMFKNTHKHSTLVQKKGFRLNLFTKVQLCDFNFWGFRFQENYWRISHVSRVSVNIVIRTDVLSVEIFFKLKSICPYKNKIITINRPKMV